MNRRKSWFGSRVHKECVYSCFLGCSVRITMLCKRCIRSFVSGSFYPLWNEECMYNFSLCGTTCMFLKYKDSWRLPFWYIKPTFHLFIGVWAPVFWGAVTTLPNLSRICPTLLPSFIVIFRRPSYFFLLTLHCYIKCQRYERYFEQSYLTWPTFQQVTFIFCSKFALLILVWKLPPPPSSYTYEPLYSQP